MILCVFVFYVLNKLLDAYISLRIRKVSLSIYRSIDLSIYTT